MSFALDLENFAKKTQIKLDKVVRKVVIDMTSEITYMTPVGYPPIWEHPESAPPGYTGGHLRSNYFWGVQRVASVDPSIDETGSVSNKRALAFASGLKAGGVVYLTNNLPYAMAVEFGHSKMQAPAGMARITVARFQGMVNKIVQGLR